MKITNIEIGILAAYDLPKTAEGAQIYVSWRRIEKGRSKKSVCLKGNAIWNPESKISFTLEDSNMKLCEEQILTMNLCQINPQTKSRIQLGCYRLNLKNIHKEGGTVEKESTVRLSEIPRSTTVTKSDDDKTKQQKDMPSLHFVVRCSSETITKTITETVNEDNVSKQVKLEKEEEPVEEEPKSTAVFGKDILSQLIVSGERRYTVPPAFRVLIDALYQEGCSKPGIFRLSGRSHDVNEIINILNDNPSKLDCSSYGIHEIADCLKKYLRALPNSLLPVKLYDECLKIGGKYSNLDASKLDKIKELEPELQQFINTLPPENASVLRELSSLLYAIQLLNGINKMTIDNLALVFAPTVIQNDELDPARFLTDNGMKIGFMKALIYYAPQWKANEDFSAIDEELLAKEKDIPLKKKVLYISDRLAHAKESIELKKQEIQRQGEEIEKFKLMQFIFQSNPTWNEDKKKYNTALEVFKKLDELKVFNPCRPLLLESVLSSLQILYQVSIFIK